MGTGTNAKNKGIFVSIQRRASLSSRGVVKPIPHLRSPLLVHPMKISQLHRWRDDRCKYNFNWKTLKERDDLRNLDVDGRQQNGFKRNVI
jgi:hypothetical protein